MCHLFLSPLAIEHDGKAPSFRIPVLGRAREGVIQISFIKKGFNAMPGMAGRAVQSSRYTIVIVPA
ncbi:MAG: hypothetical protein KZQ85_13490 [Candidatus Thiodiazotropha sp. (ex Myrtea sp. 'scaly one' KF741663)]|nr:hypothetical protein [Candidatus Thiodiazotropha sp. (ex Myrtea sp. 'scaly one' KF741663)]